MIKELLKDKTPLEQSIIKSEEIARLDHVGTYDSQGLTIEILSLEKIEIKGHHGVEIMAKAWKNGKPVGFVDGTVEIERFRIFNPGIFIHDGTFTDTTDKFGNDIRIPGKKEDLIECTHQVLARIINAVGKDSDIIVPGKIGNTTSTFNPASGQGGTTTDDYAYDFESAGTAWATIHAAAGDTVDDNETQLSNQINKGTGANSWRLLLRPIMTFDTSAIPDTDTISSASMTLVGSAKADGLSITPGMNIYSAAPASNGTIVAGDYDSVGSTAFSTAITYGNWDVTPGNNVFDLNASGIANINVSGISRFSALSDYDGTNTEPTTVVDGNNSRLLFYAADNGSSQPLLTVVHAGASTSSFRNRRLTGIGQ